MKSVKRTICRTVLLENNSLLVNLCSALFFRFQCKTSSQLMNTKAMMNYLVVYILASAFHI